MPKFSLVLAFAMSMLFGYSNAGVKPDQPLDIVFCVDLSGSTNGLVSEFRENYSHILNQIATLKPKPDVRVGLVAFSRKSYGKKNAYVKILAPLSGDLDRVSREFWKMALSIEQGDQYVAAAMNRAIDDLNWTSDPNGLKVMLLVGNGVVSLGTTSYTEVSEKAKENNIIINTIYCKPSNVLRELSGWRRIAKITSGKQYDIDLAKETKDIEADIDMDKLKQLNRELNNTYVGFGPNGQENVELLKESERILEKGPAIAYLARMYFKISDEYFGKQYGWDLVDWTLAGNSNWKELDRMHLDRDLRKLSDAELEYHVFKHKVKRKEAAAQMRKLLTEDVLNEINEFVVNERNDNEKFEKVIINSILEYSTQQGFTAALPSQ